MQKKVENIDRVLPYGEILRGFASQPTITDADLKGILRGRGIFLGRDEKEDSIPILETILLSPSEFDDLKECQSTREDNQKRFSNTIDWDSPINLVEAISSIEDLSLFLDLEYANYELTGSPTIAVHQGNPNHLKIDIEIERHDTTKAWYNNKDKFTGSLYLEKVADNKMKVSYIYTAPEVQNVLKSFTKGIVGHCKDNKYINSDRKLKKILFSDFSNEKRIKFFKRLTSIVSSPLIPFELVDVVNISFHPNEVETLPTDIDWMKKKRELILKGQDIHETFFIKEVAYHKFIVCWSMEVKFKFKNHLSFDGDFSVVMGFPDYPKKRSEDSEFELNISGLTTKTNSTSSSKNNLKADFLKMLDNYKNVIYQEFVVK